MEEPKKKSNSFLFIVIGIVLVLCCCICSVAGFFLWQSGAITTSLTFTNPPQPLNPTPSVTPTTTVTTTPTVTVTPSKPVATDTKTYTNSKFDFSFDYPKDWRAEEKSSGGPVVQIFSAQENSSDTFLENLNVVVDETPNSYDLDEVVSELSKSYKQQFANFNLITTTKMRVGGLDARKMTYTATVNGVDIKQFQIYLKDGDRGYFFTYSGVGAGFSKFESDALDVISSVSFN
jgi:hypothetical protein